MIVCNAEFLRSHLLRNGASPEKLKVIYNTPPKRCRDLESPIPTIPDTTTIVYIGQISEHKGVPILVDAILLLLEAGHRLRLFLVGESTWGGDLDKKLKEKVAATDYVENFHFFGYVDNVQSLLRSADIHVCPSIWNDPSPNVVFEAKEQGVPTVAFQKGGISEIIMHKIDGFLCRNCTSEALAEGLLYFINDPLARKQAGKAAFKSFEQRFGRARFAAEWRELFMIAKSA